MVTADGVPGPSSSDKEDPSQSIIPLKDLESPNNENAQEAGRSDDSLDMSGDEAAGQGLLGGRPSNRPSFSSGSTQNSVRPRWFGSLLRGPDPPRKHRIKPIFKSFQTAPIRMVKRLLPSAKSQMIALLVFNALWAVTFLTILNWSVVGPEIPGYGTPNRLSCAERLWWNSNVCGIDGDACRPFDDHAFAFRCPAGCLGTVLLEPYTVGDQELNYRNLVVGGDGPYRGDSSLCPAAIHAGVINNAAGGCGILRRTGEQNAFTGLEKNGISSVSFDSYFPLSFVFERETVACHDSRWLLLAISVVFTSVVSLCTTTPAAFYISIWFITWFQVALASDPPFFSDYLEVVSTGLGRLLPAAFIGWAIYYFCVRETLSGLTAQWEKTILWLGPCWVGALNTDTFDRLPISRLTPHDIQQQPGAIPALIIIVSIIVLAMVSQAWAIWSAGRLPRYLMIYGSMAGALLVMLALPQLNLRIHHYILALLFLPGTALQTRPCLIYQGLLVGLFINGIARWGFDSILQTPNALRGDAQIGSLLPEIAPPVITGNNLTFWLPTFPADVSGIAVVVNDVLRSHLYSTETPFEWTRLHRNHTEYFRFAYITAGKLMGLQYQDFTNAGVWENDGNWIHMPPKPGH